MKVLVVAAHHDDLELGCGGTVAKLVDGGHNVFSLVMTGSGYSGSDNTVVRSDSDALDEGKRAAKILNYQLQYLDEDTFDITVCDKNIRHILDIIAEHNIDTIFTHWHGDTHPPHQRVGQMALHVSRRIPRVLGFAVNWYIGSAPFSPNHFVPIEESHWNRKMQALRCYESEFRRAGEKWVAYLDNQTSNYGIQIGAKCAEAFIAYKYVWDI